MAFERIDAHHHLWRYDAAQYPWMTGEMDSIRHDFLVEDLAAVTRESQITGTVVVQARQSVEETRWLSELASNSELIRGVVGWAPLTDARVLPVLESLASLPKVRAIRHVLHDEPDDAYMLREDFNRGVSYLRDIELVYDLLVFERHLPHIIEFVDRHPDQIFVLDHIGKPQIRNRQIEPWDANIKELGQRENVYCKVSGMATEADWKEWCDDDLQRYFDIVLEAFGADRLMFGSDWPVPDACRIVSALGELR
jgi:L-fuconolactonase